MMRLAIPVLFCLVTGVAQGGTFELTDPASEVYEEFEKEKQAAKEEAPLSRPVEPAAAQPQPVAAQPATRIAEPRPAGGVGTTPCPEIVSYKQDAPRWYEVRFSWALGYVNAASSPAAEPQPEALDGWIEFYCREHPDTDLAGAAEAFVRFRASGD